VTRHEKFWLGVQVLMWLAFIACVMLSAACVGPQVKLGADGLQFNWAIQGVYSQLDCSNQPTKSPYYVDVLGDDGQYHSYFLECR
jgi:hypothetical protein